MTKKNNVRSEDLRTIIVDIRSSVNALHERMDNIQPAVFDAQSAKSKALRNEKRIDEHEKRLDTSDSIQTGNTTKITHLQWLYRSLVGIIIGTMSTIYIKMFW